MSCCNATIIPFFNQASTTIAYGPTFQSRYGSTPYVQVLYWDGEIEEYYVSNAFTRMQILANSIVINHGGPATGIIKVT